MASVAPLFSDSASVVSVSTGVGAGSSTTGTVSTGPFPGVPSSLSTSTGGPAGPNSAGGGSAGGRDPGHYNSSDVDVLLRARVVAFEGRLPELGVRDILDDPFQRAARRDGSELFVTCQLFADNKPWTVPSRTTFTSNTDNAEWNEWLSMPVKIRDLAPTAQLVFTLWDLYSPGRYTAIGGTTFRLFTQPKPDRPCRLKEGSHKLDLWPNCEGDGSDHSRTPSKSVATEEAHRRDKLLKLFEGTSVARVDWLDRAAMEALQLQTKMTTHERPLALHIYLPKYDFPVYYHAKLYTAVMTKAPTSLVLVQDPESMRESPIEVKHLRLARGHRSSPVDRDLKPNPAVRNRLNAIMAYPPTTQLSLEEKDLLWRFRFFLTREKKALNKFLKAVVWEEPAEERQALELLERWAPIDMEDALELLTPAFVNHAVRAYAVGRLRTVDDEELQLYLLQLVQALKFEGYGDRSSVDGALATFLIHRATENPILGNYLLWYLIVETEDPKWSEMYGRVNARLMEEIVAHAHGQERHDVLRRQRQLLTQIGNIYVDLGNLSRPKKIERLKAILATPSNHLSRFLHPVTLPLDPSVIVTGIVPETAFMFKSAKLPLFLSFNTVDVQRNYTIVFKQGDDVRQDQLVINIIQLMDRLLKKEKLDLQLTSYRVLATGSSQGMIEFITADPLAKILEEHGNDLQAFLRKHNRDDAADYQIAPAVMDTYIKSCAGFCVITYLLGIGDRHLDNLLLTKDGKLVHIDFGYILGNDPKLFPPPMKLCPEMVMCMGGVDSAEARKFRSLCYLAFNTLRKSANLILNLFALMVHSNVADIRADPDKAVLKVQENFQLNKSDEEAIRYFRDLINTSMTAMFPQVFETMHKWAQYMRK